MHITHAHPLAHPCERPTAQARTHRDTLKNDIISIWFPASELHATVIAPVQTWKISFSSQ